MQFRHANKALLRIDDEAGCTGGYSVALVRAFRLRMQAIRSAPDERDFYLSKALHFEKLKCDRQHQRSHDRHDRRQPLPQRRRPWQAATAPAGISVTPALVNKRTMPPRIS